MVSLRYIPLTLLLVGMVNATAVWNIPITEWGYDSFEISTKCTPFRQHVLIHISVVMFWAMYFISRKITRKTWPHLQGKTLSHFLNINVSLIHSTLASILLTLAFITNFDNFVREPYWNQCFFMDLMVGMSTGYFFYDVGEYVVNQTYKGQTFMQVFQMLFHHLGTICILGMHSLQCDYSGWTGITMIMEYNSIFLHLRKQMLTVGADKRYPTLFNLNLYIQYGTFIFFRLVFLLLMHINHFLDKERVQAIYPGYYIPGLVFFFPLFHILNFHLFYKLSRADHRYFLELRRLEKEKRHMYKYGSMKLLVEGKIC